MNKEKKQAQFSIDIIIIMNYGDYWISDSAQTQNELLSVTGVILCPAAKFWREISVKCQFINFRFYTKGEEVHVILIILKWSFHKVH